MTVAEVIKKMEKEIARLRESARNLQSMIDELEQANDDGKHSKSIKSLKTQLKGILAEIKSLQDFLAGLKRQMCK